MTNPWGENGPSGQWCVDGDGYSGTLSVERLGDVLLCNYETTVGIYRGTGLMYNGHLLLARSSADQRPGIVWYTLGASKHLQAVWNSAGLDGRIGTGRASPSETQDIYGTRLITYFNPDGMALPELNLGIKKNGQSLEISWHTGDPSQPSFLGVGQSIDNETGVVVAWDRAEPEKPFTMIDFAAPVQAGGCAEGCAVTSGSGEAFTETLTRMPTS